VASPNSVFNRTLIEVTATAAFRDVASVSGLTRDEGQGIVPSIGRRDGMDTDVNAGTTA